MRVDTTIKYGVRNIQNGKQYEKYFDLSLLRQDDKINFHHSTVQDTLAIMEQIANKYKGDTAKISKILEGKSLKDTLGNIHGFVIENIQYSKDAKTLEQVCRPLRLWKDRDGKQGHTDCDCMSVFVSSILINLKIPHAYRMAGYGGGEFQHVYVVVFDKKHPKGYFAVDGVVHEFDREVEYSKKQDKNVNMAIQVLDGIPHDLGDQHIEERSVFSGHLFGVEEPLKSAEITQEEKSFLMALKNHLTGSISLLQGNENDLLRRQMLYLTTQMGSLKSMIKGLRFLARKKNFWQKILGEIQGNGELLNGLEDLGRQQELIMLGRNGIFSIRVDSEAEQADIEKDIFERRNNKRMLGNYYQEVTQYNLAGFGHLSGAKTKAFFKKIGTGFKKMGAGIKKAAVKTGQAIKKAAVKTGQAIKKAAVKTGQAIKKAAVKTGQAIKKAAIAVGKGLKKIGKWIMKWNPLSLTIKGGILAALSLNFLNIGYKIGIGRLTWVDAQKLGVSQAVYDRCRKANARLETIYVKVFQGEIKRMHKAAMNGLKKKLKKLKVDSAGVNLGNFGNLGDFIAVVTAVGLAAANLAPVIEICKGIMPILGGKNADAEGGDPNEMVDPNSPEMQEITATEYSEGQKASNPQNWQAKAASVLQVGAEVFSQGSEAMAPVFYKQQNDDNTGGNYNTPTTTENNSEEIADNAAATKSSGMSGTTIAILAGVVLVGGYLVMKK